MRAGMTPTEFEAFLRAEVDAAKHHYEKAKMALEAYISTKSKGDLPKNRFPREKPSSIIASVRKAVNMFEDGHVFTTEDVFQEMKVDDINNNLIYSRTRPSISVTLSHMIDEGRLIKINRRSFKKVKPKTAK